MQEIEISSIAEYITALEGLSGTFFRGHPNEVFSLLPGLFRMEKEARPTFQIKFENEYELIKSAEWELWSVLRNYDEELDRLAILQHYGLKTRLLDITTNPLAALYFACDDERYEDKNGCVFVGCNTICLGEEHVQCSILENIYAPVIAKAIFAMRGLSSKNNCILKNTLCDFLKKRCNIPDLRTVEL